MGWWKMKLIFIDVHYKGEVKLTKECLDYLKKFKNVGLFTTTQFNYKINQVVEQLEKNGNIVVSSQPERTNAKFQVLGCDMYHGNLKLPKKVDVFLYVGDGRFHPNALLFHEEDSKTFHQVVLFNPTNNKTDVLTEKDVKKVIDRRTANMKKFLTADYIGVVVTTKPGQEHLHYVEKLKKAFPEKKFYPFIADQINISEFSNFKWIQSWINTACPRIGMEDAAEIDESLLNVVEALRLAKR